MPAHTRALIRIVLRGRAMPLHSYTLCFIFSSSIFINNPCALNDDVWSVDTWSGTHVSAERWIFIFISFVGYNVMRIQLHDEKYKNITESEIDKCRIDIDNWSERTDCFYKIPSMLSSAMRFYFIVSKNDTETRANWIASNIWNQMTPAARYWIIKVHCSLTIELNFFCMRRRPRLHRRRVPNFISEALPINSYQSIFHVREVPNPHGDMNSSIIMNNCSHMPFDPYYDFLSLAFRAASNWWSHSSINKLLSSSQSMQADSLYRSAIIHFNGVHCKRHRFLFFVEINSSIRTNANPVF